MYPISPSSWFTSINSVACSFVSLYAPQIISFILMKNASKNTVINQSVMIDLNDLRQLIVFECDVAICNICKETFRVILNNRSHTFFSFSTVSGVFWLFPKHVIQFNCQTDSHRVLQWVKNWIQIHWWRSIMFFIFGFTCKWCTEQFKLVCNWR